MVEESVEGFVAQYRGYAAPVEILPHVEGAPLLECVVGTTVLQVLERTGPYLARPGRAHVIINPSCERLERLAEGRKALSTPALGTLEATGPVLELADKVLIVDALVPLVVFALSELPEDLALGDWVRFTSLAPVHGFVVPREARVNTRGREVDGAL